MRSEKPLWFRLYFDDCYAVVARAVGYAGCPYRELQEKLTPLTEQFGRGRVEAAVRELLTIKGPRTPDPKPLSGVKLRAEARKLCWQLLGPPPGHPEYDAVKGVVPKPDAAPAPKTRRRRKKHG